MRYPLIIAALALVTCTTPRPRGLFQVPPRLHKPNPALPCHTVCGMRAGLEAGDCTALNAAEARILYFYQQDVADFAVGYENCMALDGWTVRVHTPVLKDPCNPPAWSVGNFGGKPFCVLGYVTKELATIELSDKDFTFNALAHEVGHVLDAAHGTAAGSHCGWERRGLNRAILEAADDANVPDEDCD
jgi:hypothetical protein